MHTITSKILSEYFSITVNFASRMYEKECDTVLNLLYDLRYKRIEIHNGAVEPSYLLQQAFNIGIRPNIVEIVMAILITDGYVTSDIKSESKLLNITQKVRAFIATTSYEEQSQLLELQKQLNQKTHLKLEQDILLNKWLLRTKWVPLILSIFGIIISVLAYNESRKEHNQKPNYENPRDTVKNNK
jgi:hypothetical protein